MCQLDHNRVGFVAMPHMPLESRPFGSEAVYLRDIQRHQSFNCFIQSSRATAESTHNSVVSKANNASPKLAHIALLHFHPAVVDYWKSVGLNHKMPTTMPKQYNHGSTRLPSCTAMPNEVLVVPSVTIEELETELSRREFQQPHKRVRLHAGLAPLSAPPPSTEATSVPAVGNVVEVAQDGGYRLNDEEERKLHSLNELTLPQAASILADADSELSSQSVKLERLQEENYALKKRVQELEARIKFTSVASLSRFLICTDSWHELNPSAAHLLFGFSTWKETKLYISALFGVSPPTANASVLPTAPLSPFEEILLTKMRFRKRMDLDMLALIWGKFASTVGRIIRHRAKEWGDAGKDLSILDVTPEYLQVDLPEEYRDSTVFSKTCALVDGKCYKTNTFRKSSALSRAQYCSKVEWSALLSLNWQTPSGLSVEHTPPYLGRTTETALAKLWGSYAGTVPTLAEADPAVVSLPLCNSKAVGSADRKRSVRSAIAAAQTLPPGGAQHEEGQADGNRLGDHAGEEEDQTSDLTARLAEL